MAFWAGLVVVLILVGLGSVAFITLLERKTLGLSQIRLGPNKVTLSGMLQPIADGVKLLAKQQIKSGLSHSALFVASPMILLMLFMTMWGLVLVWSGNNLSLKFSSLLLFSLLGCSTYAVIMTGWSIMSTFAKLGSLRGILQSLSYEVAMMLVFLSVLLFVISLSLSMSVNLIYEFLVGWMLLWLLLTLMDTNRAPFDLLEGESELISGFNVEMGSLTFVFLFLSEYGMILVLSGILASVVESVPMISLIFMSMLVLMARSCYPRVRYDTLMSMMWQSLLPLSVVLFFLGLFMK